MFDDPRSGLDRRAQRRNVVEQQGERRRNSDRRVFSAPREGGPWWLMRQLVSDEKFPGGSNSPVLWLDAAEDPPA